MPFNVWAQFYCSAKCIIGGKNNSAQPVSSPLCREVGLYFIEDMVVLVLQLKWHRGRAFQWNTVSLVGPTTLLSKSVSEWLILKLCVSSPQASRRVLIKHCHNSWITQEHACCKTPMQWWWQHWRVWRLSSGFSSPTLTVRGEMSRLK